MSVRGIRFKHYIIVMAILSLVLGVYIVFFRTSGYVRTEASVVSVKPDPDFDEDNIVTVSFSADGTSCTAEISYPADDCPKQGDTVDILYDPEDPTKAMSVSTGMGIYMIVLGILLLAWEIVSGIREKKAMAELRNAAPNGIVYRPSEKGEERELYFLSDTGTAKVGHRIEDRNREVLYEAKVTKFTLTAPTGFEFIDHVHGTTEPHLVSHEESTEWDTIILDNHYTFTLDGEFIWSHLKRHGITVESSFMEGKVLWPEYRIYRDGEQIALVQSSSYYVHEEDAEEKGKLYDLVPMEGFYRIFTREKNLDLLFTAIMAFARTGAQDDTGGSYGLLFSIFKKKKSQ